LVRTAPMPGCGARATAPRCTYGSCASPRRTSGRRALNILGISGFERAIPFKRAHWPGLDEREYRLSQGHDSAAVLVADGRLVADGVGGAHGVTAYRAHDGRLDPVLEIGAHDSIGVLYSLVTLHLGFDFNADEYKIMGLAPYGDPERFRPFFEEAVELLPGGGVRIPLVRANRTREEREHYSASRRLLSERLVRPR